MAKGFITTGRERVPYWVTQAQAERLARRQGGQASGFWMSLPGYGQMEPVLVRFVVATDAEIGNRAQWRTYLADGRLDPDCK